MYCSTLQFTLHLSAGPPRNAHARARMPIILELFPVLFTTYKLFRNNPPRPIEQLGRGVVAGRVGGYKTRLEYDNRARSRRRRHRQTAAQASQANSSAGVTGKQQRRRHRQTAAAIGWAATALYVCRARQTAHWMSRQIQANSRGDRDGAATTSAKRTKCSGICRLAETERRSKV